MKKFVYIIFGLLVPVIVSINGFENSYIAATVVSSMLFIPGFMITIWLWPKSNDIDFGRRLCITPLLSILIFLLVSIVYWFAFDSISINSILIIISSIILLVSTLHRSFRYLYNKDLLIVYGLAVLFSLLIMLVSYGITIRNQNITNKSDELSEFFLVETDAIIGFNQKYEVKIEVVNNDSNNHAYIIAAYGGGHLLNRVGPLPIPSGDRLEKIIDFPLPIQGYVGPIDFFLYRESDPPDTPFRQLRIWIGNG
jgi:hypothetical protein